MLNQRARSIKDKSYKKSLIVDSAKQLYLFETSSIPTLSEIANDSKMTKGNIYNYFKTKEEIYLYILKGEYKSWFYSFGSESLINKETIINHFFNLLKNELFINLNVQVESNFKANVPSEEVFKFYSFIDTHVMILTEKISKEFGESKELITQKMAQSLVVIQGSNQKSLKNKVNIENAIYDILKKIWS
jgi:AcrR family transcriptional regulator